MPHSPFERWVDRHEPPEECAICGRSPDGDCVCPECEVCGETGNPACLVEHGLEIAPEHLSVQTAITEHDTALYPLASPRTAA